MVVPAKSDPARILNVVDDTVTACIWKSIVRLTVNTVVIEAAVAVNAFAHDISADTTGTLTTSSSNNPRAGSFGANLGGTAEFNDFVSAWAGFGYTRDLGTKTGDSKSDGSNVFLINAGVMWLPTDNWMFMASGNFSPRVEQQSALALALRTGTTSDAVVINTTTDDSSQKLDEKTRKLHGDIVRTAMTASLR